MTRRHNEASHWRAATGLNIRLGMMAALAFAVALGGCQCGREPVKRNYAQLVVQPSAVDFGQLAPGESKTLSVRMENTGGAALHVESSALADDARGAFALAGALPSSLDPGRTVELDVRYTAPGEEGVDGATLVIRSDAQNAPEVRVSLGGRSAHPPCGQGQARCAGSCTDITQNDAHCGACGTLCTGQQRCVTSQCTCVPLTCEDLGRMCGEAPDGCGGMTSCPACTVPRVCSEQGACVLPRKWGAPALISEVSTTGDEAHGTMTADRLRICFTSARSGGQGSADIWCADRSTTSEPFGAPVNQAELNGASVDWMAELSPDGAELFFASDRAGGAGGAFDLWRATRDPATGRYVGPTALTALNTAEWETGPSLSDDGLALYFDREGDLYRVSRPAVGAAFGAPSALSELNSADAEQEPGPSDALGFVTFCSNRIAPPTGYGRLWGAEVTGATFGAPSLLDVAQLGDAAACGPELLSDGSLLFHSGISPGPGLFIAPPLP